MFDHIITEAICEDLAGQRWDRDTSRLSLKNIAKIFEVGISSANTAVTKLEGGDICAADNLIVCVHVTTHSMGAGILNLEKDLESADEGSGLEA